MVKYGLLDFSARLNIFIKGVALLMRSPLKLVSLIFVSITCASFSVYYSLVYQGKTLHLKGATFDFTEEYAKAIESYQQALVIRKILHDPRGQINTLNGMGIVYRHQENYLQALKIYQQALGVSQQANYSLEKIDTLNNIGVVYEKQRKNSEALSSYYEALQLAKTEGDREREGTILSNIGVVHASLGDSRKALDFCQQALITSSTAPGIKVNILLLQEKLGRDVLNNTRCKL